MPLITSVRTTMKTANDLRKARRWFVKRHVVLHPPHVFAVPTVDTARAHAKPQQVTALQAAWYTSVVECHTRHDTHQV
jgi:hypothetical protein